MEPICYAIDGEDRLVEVNDAWAAFALENDGDTVRPALVLGRPLWDFVGGNGVRDIYRRLLKQAREGVPVQFTYRCDSATRRRRFEMDLSARGDRIVFQSRLLEETPRDAIELFDAHAPRAAGIILMCSWCHALATPEGTWEPLEQAVARRQLLERDTTPRVSHGICEACAARVFPQWAIQPR